MDGGHVRGTQGPNCPSSSRAWIPGLGVITRVMLNIDAWDSRPRRLAAGGRRIHVGWFHTMDAHMIGLTTTDRKRFALLVVPPTSTTASAGIAMTMAAEDENSTRPADILAASETAT